MNKIFAGIVIASALASGCDYKDLGNSCYRGRVIWSSCCTGSTFISIQSLTPIGKNTRLNDQTYSNVIQVPGYITGPEVYLNLRSYDAQNDATLFSVRCYCLVAVGADVPKFVATSISTTSCSEEH